LALDPSHRLQVRQINCSSIYVLLFNFDVIVN
jgi:hypothetical protein